MANPGAALIILIGHKISHWRNRGRQYLGSQACLEKLFIRRFVNSAIDHNHVQLIVLLKNGNIFQWITINQNDVGKVARLNLAQLIFPHKKFCNTSRGRDDRLHRCEIQELDKVLQVASVSAMRSPGKAIITATVDI